MKVLLVGGLGYVGTRLFTYLSSIGLSVDISDAGFFENCHFPDFPPSIPFHKIHTESLEESFLVNYDCIVLLSGISNDPMNSMSSYDVYEPSRLYSRYIGDIFKRHSIKLIFASSCSVYGKSSSISPLTEQSVASPQTGYSLNKYQIEQDLNALADDEFRPIALRFATVFGPSLRMRFDIFLNMFVAMAFVDKKIVLNSDGLAWRPSLFIDDLCNSVALFISSDLECPGLSIFNVGDPSSNRTILNMANLVTQLLPNTSLSFLDTNPDSDPEGLVRDRKVLTSDVRSYQVDFSKFHNQFPDFHWTTLVDGIQSLVDFYQLIPLDIDLFKTRLFYRLQALEDLLADGSLDHNLRWKK